MVVLRLTSHSMLRRSTCRVSLYPGTHSDQGRFEPAESQVLDMDICDQYTLQERLFP